MNLIDFFNPSDELAIAFVPAVHKKCLGDTIKSYTNAENSHFPQIEGVDIAIIGIEEDRQSSDNKGSSTAPDLIRKSLYKLTNNNQQSNIIDLGNVKKGKTVEDTYSAVKTVISELLSMGIVVIIIGGSHDMTLPCFEAYSILGTDINIGIIDSEIDLGPIDSETSSKNYLDKLIMNNNGMLFNLSNIGYQSYFVDNEVLRVLDTMYFDSYRLGEIREDIKEVEPLVRDADFISIDISAVRQSDAPGNNTASPNGINGEELCKISWYCGMSDKLSAFGLFEVNPLIDNNEQTTRLSAQAIWYFIEGFYSRKHDYMKESSNFLKYHVSVENHDDSLIFYKSKKSGRWWFLLEVETQDGDNKTHFVPCSYKDYQTACNNELPEKWWRTYKKLI